MELKFVLNRANYDLFQHQVYGFSIVMIERTMPTLCEMFRVKNCMRCPRVYG